MRKMMGHRGSRLMRMTLVLGLALGAGACSTMADLDPTGLLSDDSSSASSDAPPSAGSDVASTTPDLAALPPRPATSTADQQQATSQSLAADGAQARYSADALRAGTEPAAPPPAPASASAAQTAAQMAAMDAPPSAEPAPQPAPSPEAAAPAPAMTASAAPPPSAMPSAPAVRTALPPGAEPAVPPDTPVRGVAMGAVAPSDAALGFRPSAAPPLNPGISQWVPAPIVARYRQTAALSGTAGMSAPAVGGAVMTDAGTPAASIAAMNGGVPPSAVVYFSGDGVTLNAAAMAEIRGAAAKYKAGGVSTIRVVGHASSRTADMPVEKHLETIFDKSQARANAVAQALIHAGVPADKVLVEAVGDSQPVYYESMPKGEEGNRRAEIFLQG